jgi:hypothetical protein
LAQGKKLNYCLFLEMNNEFIFCDGWPWFVRSQRICWRQGGLNDG